MTRETLVATLVYRLGEVNASAATRSKQSSLPRTRRLFSGSLFPLATDSSIDVHRFFFSPFLLSASPEPLTGVDSRSVLAAMTASGRANRTSAVGC